jgi:hypothetical protein
MRHQYFLICRFKPRDFFGSVKEIEDSINRSMSLFGFSEKMFLETETKFVEMTTDRLLTPDEEKAIVLKANEVFAVDQKIECTGIKYSGVV